MKAKTICLLAFCLILLPIAAMAQNDSSSTQQNYLRFLEQARKEYEDFRAKAQNEFEQFLAKAWMEYQSFSGDAGYYAEKKPEELPSLPYSSGIIDIDAPSFESIITPQVEPEQKNDFGSTHVSQTDKVAISFYGRHLEFDVPASLRIKSGGIRERQVANYHETMRKNGESQVLQKQLDETVRQMGLNEWGYFTLLRAISEKLFTDTNDRVLFSFYMLHSNGFKARVGRGKSSGQLLLLLALDNSKEVYSLTFFRINGTKFYIVYGNGIKGESVYSYDEKADYSGLKEIGLDFAKPLNIAACDQLRKLHLDKANLDIELPYSTSHLRYYDDIPTTVFPIYFKTAVSNEAEQALTQTFNTLGKRYNKVQMVDIMLNFVQNAFAYKIDELQFGREKYFFPEEVIGLPFSDCEDRSALFAWLVSHYVGYDVVGVLYNDHLATAVCFGDDAKMEGKTIMHKGKPYIVCDPTYSNAAIGTVMPKFANAKYEIIEINRTK